VEKNFKKINKKIKMKRWKRIFHANRHQ
jgi:hypothetical protein